MRRARRLKIIVPIVVVGLLAVFALAGLVSGHVSGGGASGGGSAGESVTGAPRSTGQHGLAAVAGGVASAKGARFSPSEATSPATASSSGGTSAMATLEPTAAHYLVRNGDLSLLVGRGGIMAAVDRITSLTSAMGGYVVSSAVGSQSSGVTASPEPLDSQSSAPADGSATPLVSAGDPYAALTVRVPETAFETALQRFSTLGEVVNVSTTSEDVTSQYVDLQARLSHFRAVELRLVRFLAATHTVNQMLAVQDRIDSVQLTIEQLTAQIKSLHETTAYGTLSLFVRERGRTYAVTATSGTFSGTLWRSIKLLGRGARATALVITALLPFVVVFAAIGATAWWVTRRLRRRRPARPSLPA